MEGRRLVLSGEMPGNIGKMARSIYTETESLNKSTP
jgi:hypothetical protein